MEEEAQRLPLPAGLTVRRWSTERWLASEDEWRALTLQSGSDPLFLSWDWLIEWWRCFGSKVGEDADIRAFYRGTQLVGLAPLYRLQVRRALLLRTQSVQLIGLAWRDPEPLISEYLDVIAAPEDLGAVREACVRSLLEEGGWSEFVVGLTPTAQRWRAEFMRTRAVYVRELDPATTYRADLSSGFSAYLMQLHQSTRRSVWNLRRRLASFGEVRCEFIGARELEAGFQELNRLHQLRWQKPAFAGVRLEFHLRLAARLAARDELRLSCLRVGGRVVSVLYDLCKAQSQYNIKMAFDPAFSTQVSLGLLHLGYALEAAAGRGITRYDFLAGPGRKSDFKRLLSQERRELSCVQVLRGALLPRLFRSRDRIRQR